MQRLLECVPNFSEGRDPAIIKQITDEIITVEGILLLDVDPGKATNRTVVTFVGAPEAVVEAAFRGISKAVALIDMSKHKGEHPRFGAADVVPLIPVSGVSMEEAAAYARQLAERVGRELNYPVYLYEQAASRPERSNLATVRAGEYEGLAKKLQDADWKPDYGPANFVPRSGATAIGARDFLLAVNFNLNTTSTRRANAIAFDVREAGRVKRKGDPVTGEVVLDENGNEIRIPGKLKAAKAIGWYIEEYGIAQISMNLTNIGITSLHTAFDAVVESATERGLRVTGTEVVGLLPLRVLTEAGKHYLRKQQRSVGIPEAELIKIAIKSMGLDDLKPFDPEKKIIEYSVRSRFPSAKLAGMSLQAFADETLSESPAPGGGSISAYVGALGVALGGMVANLSAHKRGWDERWEEFSTSAEDAQDLKERLMFLVDEDTRAFNRIMEAFSLPKNSPEEKSARSKAIQEATFYAIEVPFQVMETAFSAFPMLYEMADKGNPNSVSDAGVGALCVRAAVLGAWLNVQINASGYHDKQALESIMKKAQNLVQETETWEKKIMSRVGEVMNAGSK